MSRPPDTSMEPSGEKDTGPGPPPRRKPNCLRLDTSQRKTIRSPLRLPTKSHPEKTIPDCPRPRVANCLRLDTSQRKTLSPPSSCQQRAVRGKRYGFDHSPYALAEWPVGCDSIRPKGSHRCPSLLDTSMEPSGEKDTGLSPSQGSQLPATRYVPKNDVGASPGRQHGAIRRKRHGRNPPAIPFQSS